MVRAGNHNGDIRMGRGRRGLLDDLTVLPWPAGIVVGVLGWFAIQYVIPAWLSGHSGVFAQTFAQSNPLKPLSWMVLAACALASLVSFVNARRKRRLLDTRTGLDSIAALGWRDFEQLVGEAFRRQGYIVEETGLGGADGGIDLILRKNGKRTLVQCKKWDRQKVNVSVVREMYGLLAHHGADEVRIATVGGYTPDAARFAQDKPIALIDGEALLGMIREVQAGDAVVQRSRVEPVTGSLEPDTPSVPQCPLCNMPMIQRRNRQSGSAFWGCSAYPVCKGTRQK